MFSLTDKSDHRQNWHQKLSPSVILSWVEVDCVTHILLSLTQNTKLVQLLVCLDCLNSVTLELLSEVVVMLLSGMCVEKVLFCFAKILANILGGGYVMLWSCSRWSQMLSRFAKTLIRCKIDVYRRISELTRQKHDVIRRRCWLIDSTLLKHFRVLSRIGITEPSFF